VFTDVASAVRASALVDFELDMVGPFYAAAEQLLSKFPATTSG